MRGSLLAAVLVLLLAAPGVRAAERGRATATERGTVPAVLHVHSTLSTGAHSLDELASDVGRHGVGAILLAENYLFRIEYGLPPFRALTRATYEAPSVLARGIDRYLAAVAAAQARVPGVVLVPGVEVIPHYEWSGSPFALDLLVQNTQKNLLVFGLGDPATLVRLPVIGNRAGGAYGWQSVLDALPVALLVPGVVLLATKRTRRMRVGRAIALVKRRRWPLGAVVLAVGVLALVRGWPFTVDRYPAWTEPGLSPYQDLIDDVDRAGGLSVWSFPEARDEGQHHVGPVRVGRRTDPYPDDLQRTVRYTAFGAVYEDTTSFEIPGGGWDRILGQYAAGERGRAPWAVGESGYHDESAGKRPENVQTVFVDTERSVAGILEALRHGRMYALRRGPAFALELAEFSVAAGADTAGIAGTLRVPAGDAVEVRLGVNASDGASHPVRATLVRNGTIAEVWSVTTPFRVSFREPAGRGRSFYRIDVRGDRPQRLLSNPIFVEAS